MKKVSVLVAVGVAALVIVGLVTRVVVGLSGRSGASITGGEVLLLFFGAGLGTLLTYFWAIRERTRARVRKLERTGPEGVVVSLSLRAEDVSSLNALAGSNLKVRPQFMLAVLGRSKLSLWTGSEPTLVAEVGSRQPIRYAEGKVDHLGTPAPVLQATIVLDDGAVTVPLIVIDEVLFPFGSASISRGIQKALDKIQARDEQARPVSD